MSFLGRNSILSLLIIGLIGLLLRLYNFPSDIPLTLDALNGYFLYANDISILGHLPTNYAFDNIGWPIFLSFFFSAVHSNNYIDYMNLQRILAILISVLTIIPVYLLCNRFFGKPYSILGAALFSFEPRVIQNSVLGITDPLYFCLVSLSVALVLSQNRVLRFASFGIASLATQVRSEGLFLLAAISFLFFMTQKRDTKSIAKYAAGITLFVLLLIPLAYVRLETMASDGITTDYIHFAHNTSVISSQLGKFGIVLFVERGLQHFIEYLGWVMIPIFVFFVPASAILILKKKFQHTKLVIIPLAILSLPPIYAYSQGIQETRYLYVLYPFFCVLSVFVAKMFVDRFKSPNIVLALIIGGVLLSSVVFLDVKKFDYTYDRESFGVAKYVVNVAKGVNDYYPEDSYLRPAELPSKWPSLSTSIQLINVIPTKGFDSLNKYLEDARDKGLTHLVIDQNANRPIFLSDVFNHEERYPYLTKVFDSADYNYKYHVKIYKVDYNRFEKTLAPNG